MRLADCVCEDVIDKLAVCVTLADCERLLDCDCDGVCVIEAVAVDVELCDTD